MDEARYLARQWHQEDEKAKADARAATRNGTKSNTIPPTPDHLGATLVNPKNCDPRRHTTPMPRGVRRVQQSGTEIAAPKEPPPNQQQEQVDHPKMDDTPGSGNDNSAPAIHESTSEKTLKPKYGLRNSVVGVIQEASGRNTPNRKYGLHNRTTKSEPNQ